jgi:hypothetical protein
MKSNSDGDAALSWVVCDMTNAKGVYPADGVFDCIIDKATLDALMCTDEASHVISSPGGHAPWFRGLGIGVFMIFEVSLHKTLGGLVWVSERWTDG